MNVKGHIIVDINKCSNTCYLALSVLPWFCQSGLSPEGGPSRSRCEAGVGQWDAADLSEDGRVHA